MAKVKKNAEQVEIRPIEMRTIIVAVVGDSPMLMHRFDQKAWHELLYPSQRKNAAERAGSLKHNPVEEYRGAFYKNRDPKTPTLFHVPDRMFHQALASAALDMPGATRTGMERLTAISPQINLFGVPRLHMSMVRSSDMNRTPDVRTRPIFERWCCELTIKYKTDPLTDSQILNLLGAAGQIVGVGDFRPQKKGGSFGKFRVCSASDPEYKSIVATGGRAAQQKAFDNPVAYDPDTEELLAWFTAEVAKRRQSANEKADDKAAKVKGAKAPKAPPRRGKANGSAHAGVQ